MRSLAGEIRQFTKPGTPGSPPLEAGATFFRGPGWWKTAVKTCIQLRCRSAILRNAANSPAKVSHSNGPSESSFASLRPALNHRCYLCHQGVSSLCLLVPHPFALYRPVVSKASPQIALIAACQRLSPFARPRTGRCTVVSATVPAGQAPPPASDLPRGGNSQP